LDDILKTFKQPLQDMADNGDILEPSAFRPLIDLSCITVLLPLFDRFDEQGGRRDDSITNDSGGFFIMVTDFHGH